MTYGYRVHISVKEDTKWLHKGSDSTWNIYVPKEELSEFLDKRIGDIVHLSGHKLDD